MNRRAVLAVTAPLTALACSGPGGPATVPAPDGGLAHHQPSPSKATYSVADTMMISMSSPTGSAELTAVATTTLSMRFQRDSEGVRVNAEVVDFGGSVGNPTRGTLSLNKDDARGAMVFVVGRTGVIWPVARPELSPGAGQFSLFNQLPYDLFPGLPGRVVGPGQSWSDTAGWFSSANGMKTTSTMTRRYTLVGDTVVDGRSVVAISLSAEVAISGRGSQGGKATSQSITGSMDGHLLWDAQAGLLHLAELMRRYEGRSTMEGQAPGSVNLGGPQHLRREN